MFGCRARPATQKSQPHLIVTAQSITPEEVAIMWYPAAGVLVLSVYVMVSMVTWFIPLCTHTVTQMDKILEAVRRIVSDRLGLNPFYALNLNNDICVWLWRGYFESPADLICEKQESNTTVFDKLKLKTKLCVSFREKQFMWHLKLIFPQSSTEFSQRKWVIHLLTVCTFLDITLIYTVTAHSYLHLAFTSLLSFQGAW